MESNTKKKAFSLIEVSIVIVIVGILIVAITQSSRLKSSAKLSIAKNLTNSAPVSLIPDLEIWLESSHKENFGSSTIDDGDSISIWNGINPNELTNSSVTQSITTRQPTYSKNCVNDLPCAKFDGVDDVLVYDLNINYNVMPDVTIIAVFNFSNGSSTIQALFGNDNGGWDRFMLLRHTSYTPGPSNGSLTTSFNSIATENVAKVLTLSYQNGVSSGSKAFLNGLEDSITFTENHSNSGETSFGIGAISTSGLRSMNGGIAEFIVFSRVLKDKERLKVEKYLGQKYGIKITE